MIYLIDVEENRIMYICSNGGGVHYTTNARENINPKIKQQGPHPFSWQERLFQEPKDNVCSMSNLIVAHTESERVDTNMSNMHIDMIIIYT